MPHLFAVGGTWGGATGEAAGGSGGDGQLLLYPRLQLVLSAPRGDPELRSTEPRGGRGWGDGHEKEEDAYYRWGTKTCHSRVLSAQGRHATHLRVTASKNESSRYCQ